MTYRLTLDLGEETRARWEAAAERIDYQRLDVWARDTLDAASDPDAGQVVDLRARLTTAETERDEFKAAAEELLRNTDSLDAELLAAEARVEAAERVVEAAQALVDDAEGYPEQVPNQIAALGSELDAYVAALKAPCNDAKGCNYPDCSCEEVRARAALACPPQQRGE